MLKGIAQATAITNASAARTGAGAVEPTKQFSVIRREQPAEPSRVGGPLSARTAAEAPAKVSEPGLVERKMHRIVDNQKRLERAMNRAMRGGDFSPQQLLALQMQVHKYSLEVETVSRVVDRVTGAVKQAMQTQI